MPTRKIVATTFIMVAVVLTGAYVIAQNKNTKEKSASEVPQKSTESPKNATYIIEGVAVSLKEGRAETEIAPGFTSKVLTQYFGNEAAGDLNSDGQEDAVIILTQTSGGSGTFYYAAASLKRNIAIKQGDVSLKYFGTNAILLGDRIAPQSTEIKNGIIIVNYADRKSGESMATTPSVGISKYLKMEGEILREVSR
jgi:hypothetical protein